MEIYNGVTKNGNEIKLRFAQESDLDQLLENINRLSKERTFITFQGEDISRDDEREYLSGMIKRHKERTGFFFLAFVEGKLAGGATIEMNSRNSSHVGVFGIVLMKEFRNEGIGRILIQKAFDQARILIPRLRILTLFVYEPNTIAKRLYEEFGFIEYGRLEKGAIYRDEFVTDILMKKEFKI